jgi:hypothetical protein
MIDVQTEDLPAHYAIRPGIRVTLVALPPKNLARALADYVAYLIATDVPVVLAVPGPPGHYPAHALLNDALKDAALKRDLVCMEAAFSKALASSAAHPGRFNRIVHHHG